MIDETLSLDVAVPFVESVDDRYGKYGKTYRVGRPLSVIAGMLKIWEGLLPRIDALLQKKLESNDIYYHGYHAAAFRDDIHKNISAYNIGHYGFNDKYCEYLLRDVLYGDDFLPEQKYAAVECVFGGLPSWLAGKYGVSHTVDGYSHTSCNLNEWNEHGKKSCYSALDDYFSWHEKAYDVSHYKINTEALFFLNEDEIKTFLKIYMDAELAKVKLSYMEAKAQLDKFCQTIESMSHTGEMRENKSRLILELRGGHHMVIWVDDIGTSAKRVNRVKGVIDDAVSTTFAAGLVATLPVWGPLELIFGRKK